MFRRAVGDEVKLDAIMEFFVLMKYMTFFVSVSLRWSALRLNWSKRRARFMDVDGPLLSNGR
jgi:hypothetical protein